MNKRSNSQEENDGKWGRRGRGVGLMLSALLLTGCAADPGAGAAALETVELTVLTPDAGWEFRVREARETPAAVWVWAELRRRPGMAAQQLTTVRAEVELPAGKPREVYVSGKSWNWTNDEPYHFVAAAPPWPADARVVELRPERTEGGRADADSTRPSGGATQ